MAALAEKIEVEEPAQLTMRRFMPADLTRHGGWIMRRLIQAYPNQNERSLAGFLRGIIYDNSSLFLYQDHGVALAQVSNVHTLAHKPIVYERFVFVEEGYVQQGVEFYGEFERWAKSQGIEQIIVEEMSDVPHDVIKEKLGRLYTRQQVFARV